MPLRPLVELEGLNFNHAVLLGVISYMDTLVDGKAGILPS